MDRHALFVICSDASGESATFRLGLPVDWHTAVSRHTRLAWTNRRDRVIRANRRRYKVEHYEVRSVDRHGRGLGEDRHIRAIPVPFRAARVV